MVIRTRLRAILFPLLLYAVSGGIGSYFVWTAVNGQRGLKAKEDYQVQMAGLKAELAGLQDEKAVWSHRIQLMQDSAIDADLLDEEIRNVLGRVDKADVVVFDNGKPLRK